MNLTNLPKTKSYHYQNQDTILEMCTRFGVNPRSIPKIVKDQPWSVKYVQYMKDITGHAPCPICNGPQKLGRRNALYPDGLRCIDHPNHTAAYRMGIATALNAVKHGTIIVPDGMKVDDCPEVQELAVKRILIALGGVCEHGEYRMDCEVCKTSIRAMNEEMTEQKAIEVAVDFAQAETVPA